MRETARRRRLPSEINIVPYVDVMLVLLVIFMVTAPLLVQGVEIQLPRADAAQLPRSTKDPLVVTVGRDGSYFLDLGRPEVEKISLRRLARQVDNLFRVNPDLEVVVRGDREVDYAYVVTLLATLQGIGVTRLGLVTVPQNVGPGGARVPPSR